VLTPPSFPSWSVLTPSFAGILVCFFLRTNICSLGGCGGRGVPYMLRSFFPEVTPFCGFPSPRRGHDFESKVPRGGVALSAFSGTLLFLAKKFSRPRSVSKRTPRSLCKWHLNIPRLAPSRLSCTNARACRVEVFCFFLVLCICNSSRTMQSVPARQECPRRGTRHPPCCFCPPPSFLLGVGLFRAGLLFQSRGKLPRLRTWLSESRHFQISSVRCAFRWYGCFFSSFFCMRRRFSLSLS